MLVQDVIIKNDNFLTTEGLRAQMIFFILIFSFTEITPIAYLHHLGQDSNSVLLFHCSLFSGALGNIRFPNGRHDLHLVLVCLFLLFLSCSTNFFISWPTQLERTRTWLGTCKFWKLTQTKQVVGELFSKKLNLKQKQVQSTQSKERWSDCMLIMVTGLIGVQFGL